MISIYQHKRSNQVILKIEHYIGGSKTKDFFLLKEKEIQPLVWFDKSYEWVKKDRMKIPNHILKLPTMGKMDSFIGFSKTALGKPVIIITPKGQNYRYIYLANKIKGKLHRITRKRDASQDTKLSNRGPFTKMVVLKSSP